MTPALPSEIERLNRLGLPSVSDVICPSSTPGATFADYSRIMVVSTKSEVIKSVNVTAKRTPEALGFKVLRTVSEQVYVFGVLTTGQSSQKIRR